MFQGILSWFLGGGLNAIGNIVTQIVALKQQKVNAKTELEKASIDASIKMLEDQKEVLIQGTKSNVDLYSRLFLMIPIGVYLWKFIIWDKVFNHLTDGITDGLPLEIWYLVYAVFGFYFVTDLTRILKR